MKLLRAPIAILQIVGEIFVSLWRFKRLWLAPLVLVLIVFGVLLLLATSSGLAPFIYTLF